MIRSAYFLFYCYMNAHYETSLRNLGNELFYQHENPTNLEKDIFDDFLYNT